MAASMGALRPLEDRPKWEACHLRAAEAFSKLLRSARGAQDTG
jgi:hypothetical protein